MPATNPYSQGTPKIIGIMTIVSLLMMAVTLVLVIVAWNTDELRICSEKISSVTIIYGLVGIWGILPPIWFWLEYFFILHKHGTDQDFERFKYGQQLSIAVWVVVTTLLVALASSDHFKKPASESATKQSATTDPSQKNSGK